MPNSKVLLDQNNNLLGARIATDGQWRFPHRDSIPIKFKTAIIEFEDHRFMSHWGIDPIGIVRAFQQNIRNRKIVSGGSTLTMQTARLARRNKPRNLGQKIIEMFIATRLELKYNKEEILALYTANAPFGGNVVGLDAACWRYYGKKAELLSWGEAATLAVLPNSPALIHPGRNRNALRNKRNRLLDRLAKNGKIDQFTCDLAKEEALPAKPLRLPNLAPHLLDKIYSENDNSQKKPTVSTLRSDLQLQVNKIIDLHNKTLKANEIHNLAALVLEVKTGRIIAYIGNAPNTGASHQQAVDIIKAPRSTGSILKPFLYAHALESGDILPKTILKDTPTNIGGYRPENYHQKFDGRVAADKALARSLNVPFVNLLQDYGQEKFYRNLKQLGLTSLNNPPAHYGLSLILGGAEGSLLEITNAYAGMARTLNNYQQQNGEYRTDDFRKADYDFSYSKIEEKLLKEAPILSAASIYHTFSAMKMVERPTTTGDWEKFRSGRQIAWKTGTSFGFRDAWAVGVTPEYVVGVWAGNADGEGRPGCVGIRAAAPVLFDIFSILPMEDVWFEVPYDEMTESLVCRRSGYRALADCEFDTLFVPNTGLKTKACPYHKKIHLDASEQFRVKASCYPQSNIKHKSWFILPPTEEYYYRKRYPDYQDLPAWSEACKVDDNEAGMQLIYPRKNTVVSIPRDLEGNKSRVIFEAAHRQEEKIIYWHLNEEYLGSTQDFHTIELLPPTGKNQLTLVDEDGKRTVLDFEVVD